MTMTLLYSAASPYARKVRVVAQELGLAASIDVVPSPVSPVELNADVAARNPLAKVPALIFDDGRALYDSRVIVEYLISLVPRQALLPAAGPQRWTLLRRQALADGMLDAALLARYEEALRPVPFRWPEWQAGQENKIRRGLVQLEAEAVDLVPSPRLDTIAIACTLGYLDLRFARLDWRAQCPALASLDAQIAAWPSMIATRP